LLRPDSQSLIIYWYFYSYERVYLYLLNFSSYFLLTLSILSMLYKLSIITLKNCCFTFDFSKFKIKIYEMLYFKIKIYLKSIEVELHYRLDSWLTILEFFHLLSHDYPIPEIFLKDLSTLQQPQCFFLLNSILEGWPPVTYDPFSYGLKPWLLQWDLEYKLHHPH